MAQALLQGPVMYPKIFPDTRSMEGYEGQYKPYNGMYEITVGLEQKDIDVILGWNKRYEPKTHPVDKGGVEGKQYITFKRKHEQRNKDGELIAQWSGPPKVVDVHGQDWDPNVLVGNGSICTVQLDVTKKGNKTFVRLEKVRVDELVPYEKEDEEPVDVPDAADVLPF